MTDANPAFPLLSALAAVYAAEPREEAGRTARLLIEEGPRHLGAPRPAPPEAAAMRALLAGSDHPAARAALEGFGMIPWARNDLEGRTAAEAAGISAVATLLDPAGPIPATDLSMGVFYQYPNTYYPLHNHDADETYVIIAGSAVWTAGADTRLRGAGEAIHHPSRMPHAFRTGPEGMIALWRWSGDINTRSYAFLPDPAVA